MPNINEENAAIQSDGVELEKPSSALNQATNPTTGALVPVTTDTEASSAAENDTPEMARGNEALDTLGEKGLPPTGRLSSEVLPAENAQVEALAKSADKSAELHDNERKAKECIAKGADAGKYISDIREKQQYKYRLDPRTQKPYTWEVYCPDVLKISVQYANRKIAAWKARELVRAHICEQDFEELPLTTSPWVELEKRDEDERIDVIQGVIGQFKSEGKPLGMLKAKDISDFQIDPEVEDEPSAEEYDDEEGPEEGKADEAEDDESVDVEQMANDARDGKPINYERLSPANRAEFRAKLEEMLDESLKVQENIKDALARLDNDVEQTAEGSTEQNNEQDVPENAVA